MGAVTRHSRCMICRSLNLFVDKGNAQKVPLCSSLSAVAPLLAKTCGGMVATTSGRACHCVLFSHHWLKCERILHFVEGQPSSYARGAEYLPNAGQANFPLAKVGELDCVGFSDTDRPRRGLDGVLRYSNVHLTLRVTVFSWLPCLTLCFHR